MQADSRAQFASACLVGGPTYIQLACLEPSAMSQVAMSKLAASQTLLCFEQLQAFVPAARLTCSSKANYPDEDPRLRQVLLFLRPLMPLPLVQLPLPPPLPLLLAAPPALQLIFGPHYLWASVHLLQTPASLSPLLSSLLSQSGYWSLLVAATPVASSPRLPLP